MEKVARSGVDDWIVVFSSFVLGFVLLLFQSFNCSESRAGIFGKFSKKTPSGLHGDGARLINGEQRDDYRDEDDPDDSDKNDAKGISVFDLRDEKQHETLTNEDWENIPTRDRADPRREKIRQKISEKELFYATDIKEARKKYAVACDQHNPTSPESFAMEQTVEEAKDEAKTALIPKKEKSDQNKRELSFSSQCFGKKTLNFGVVLYNPYIKDYRLKAPKTDNEARLLKKHLTDHELAKPGTVFYFNTAGYSSKFGTPYVETEKKNMREYGIGQREVDKNRKPIVGQDYSSPNGRFNEPKYDDIYLDGRHIAVGSGDLPVESLKGKKVPNATRSPLHPNTTVVRRGGRKSLLTVLKGVLTVDSSKKAILEHCDGGNHRTGMKVLMLRYLQGGKWADRSISKEITTRAEGGPGRKIQGLRKVHPTILDLAQEEYIYHNNKKFRPENLRTVEALTSDPVFKCVKEKFSCYLNASPEAGSSVKLAQDVDGACNFAGTPAVSECPIKPEDFDENARLALWQSCENDYGAASELAGQVDLLQATFNGKVVDENGKTISSESQIDAVMKAFDGLDRTVANLNSDKEGQKTFQNLDLAKKSLIKRFCKVRSIIDSRLTMTFSEAKKKVIGFCSTADPESYAIGKKTPSKEEWETIKDTPIPLYGDP